MHKPCVHVGNRVVNVEILLQLEAVDELATVLVEQVASHYLIRLKTAALATTLQHFLLSEVRDATHQLACAFDVLVNFQEFESLVKVKRGELRLDCPEVLGVNHAVVALVLKFIQVTDRPLDFEPEDFTSRVFIKLLLFCCQIHPLQVILKVRHRLAIIKNFLKRRCLFVDFPLLRQINLRGHRAVHDSFLHNFVD